MTGITSMNDSLKENQLIIERKILKARHSKHYHDRHEPVKNPRILEKKVLQFNQLEPVRVLGEGAFGEVVLMVDRDDNSICAAVKRISLRGLDNETAKQVKKEALLQKAVSGHQNVLNYIAMRTADYGYELYLEYADGGELFDQIEPDVGMEPKKAQNLFFQLLEGLEFIHSHGITHRDIKPENLLLDRHDTLKICDFGMATVFRHEGRERTLTTRCGTLPYAAPEILTGTYRGEPVDVWSAGVVLVTMLVGELPWDSATMECEQYASFIKKNGDFDRRPWCRMTNQELSILRLIFCADSGKRGKISRIKNHPWLMADLTGQIIEQRNLQNGIFSIEQMPKAKKIKMENLTSSQPAFLPSFKSARDQEPLYLMNVDKPKQPVVDVCPSLSQPVHYDLLSQANMSQPGAYANSPETLVRRMTRFCVTVSVEEVIKKIEKAAINLHFDVKHVTAYQLFIISTRNDDLTFNATIYEMIEDGKHKVLVDFRRSKGDGLDFKRVFRTFKKALVDVICPDSHKWLYQHGLLRSKFKQIEEEKKRKMPTIQEENNGIQKDVEMKE